MKPTELQQILFAEKYLNEQFEFAKRMDTMLREAFPDEAKEAENAKWFKRELNPHISKREGAMEMLVWMNPDIRIDWNEKGEHRIVGFGFEADCEMCEHFETIVCRKCRYNEVNKKESYFNTMKTDGSMWNEEEEE